jgi:hypothetical protein
MPPENLYKHDLGNGLVCRTELILPCDTMLTLEDP